MDRGTPVLGIVVLLWSVGCGLRSSKENAKGCRRRVINGALTCLL